jgi:hypothetical protein
MRGGRIRREGRKPAQNFDRNTQRAQIRMGEWRGMSLISWQVTHDNTSPFTLRHPERVG